jgi:hypothetical protein
MNLRSCLPPTSRRRRLCDQREGKGPGRMIGEAQAEKRAVAETQQPGTLSGDGVAHL